MARFGEEAELVHQPLGVERPALDLGADVADGGLVAGQLLGAAHPLGEVQMVAGNALVVPGADQLPGGERLAAQGRQPGLPGTAEVQARGAVVGRGGGPGRGDHRLHLAQRAGQVEVGAVECLDGTVHDLLQPDPDALDALDRRAVLLQVLQRLERGRAREHLLGQGPLLLLQPVELGPGPAVGLVQVQVGPGLPARGADIELASGDVRGAGGGGGIGVAQPVAELADGGGGLRGGGVQFGPAAVGTRGGEAGEPVAALAVVLADPAAQLAGHGHDLARSGEQPAAHSLRQGGPVAPEGAGDIAQSACDDGPVAVGGGRHEVEDAADEVQWAFDVVQRAEVVPGVMDRELGGQPLPQQPGAGGLGGVEAGCLLVEVAGVQRVEGGEGLPGQFRLGLEACRGQVGLAFVVEIETEFGGHARVVGDQRVQVGVGDLPRREGEGCVSHEGHPGRPRIRATGAHRSNARGYQSPPGTPRAIG